MPTRLLEYTYGTHTYMRIHMPDGIIEEIDVYWLESGPKYKVTSTSEERCQEIIKAFKELY